MVRKKTKTTEPQTSKINTQPHVKRKHNKTLHLKHNHTQAYIFEGKVTTKQK